MFTLFAISVLALAGLFAVKLQEERAGCDLFLSRLRRQADMVVVRWYVSVRRRVYRFARISRGVSRELLVAARTRLARSLKQLAESLQQ